MKKTISLLITFSSLLLFSQNYDSNIWGGISVSTSDNLDAMNLNPAGLGVERGKQFGINLQQSNFLDLQNSNLHILSIVNRYNSGFGIQHQYDEVRKYNWTLGYGYKLFDNFYSGVRLNKQKDYSLGLLYRPQSYLSTGLTVFTNMDDTYRDVRYGLSMRPLYFMKNNKTDTESFLNYSNLTFGYDKLVNCNKNWKEASFSEYFFLNLDIVPGVNIGVRKGKSSSYAVNLSINLGNNGFSINNYPSSNASENSLSSNGVGYYTYSQKQDSKANFLSPRMNNYVYLELEGNFIEEKPKKNLFNFDIKITNLLSLGENNLEGVQLRTFIDKINEASNNKHITGLIIKLGDIQAGFGKRKEIYNAFSNFKKQNKEIIVYSDKNLINTYDYYLISMADKIYSTNHTEIDLKGINMEYLFLRGLLDTIYVVPEVVRVSPYKTAGDMVLNKEMSYEMKENYTQLLNDFYEILVEDISNGRGWSKTQTNSIIENGPYYLTKNAIKAGLVDSTMYPDQFEDFLDDKKNHLIDWDDIKPNNYYIHDWNPNNTPKIAIIYAVGGIMSGESNPGTNGSTIMGDKTITKAIKSAREDKNIEAIVLRIDSGGGSVLASDMIWREIEKTTNENSENKKPVIVSMSDVAASGGYYIGCEADYIMSDPTTVTGSIGVIWVRLNFSNMMKKIGINFDGIKSTDNADFSNASHLLTDLEKEKIYEVIYDEYLTFKEKVVNGRENLNNINDLDSIALGRIWSGKMAKELGLVDEIGGLHDALNKAKSLANINKENNVNIVEYPESSTFGNLFEGFGKENKAISIIDLENILPKELAEKLEVLELLPVMMDNQIQFLMPYKIVLN